MDIGFIARRIVIAVRVGQARERARDRQEAAARSAAEAAAQRELGRRRAAELRAKRRPPRDAVTDEQQLERAERFVIENQDGSTTALGRELGVGVLTAIRLMSQLEKRGIVGPQIGTEPREVLVRRSE